MITSTGLPEKYLARFTDGKREALTDTTPQHGGTGAGFKPMDLLEAAVASCITTVLRMAADKRGIPLTGIRASVGLNLESKEESVFTYSVELDGELTDEQRSTLLRAAEACPVKKALSRSIVFRAQE